ncbi:aspartate/glutamate racemase family protein [Ectobacillus funiculus]|uniref:aspartate/glutamate racemase family protein n=1 Tax=Ectobacillus funiculus TaxID=137993 RepID=UPI00397D4D31
MSNYKVGLIHATLNAVNPLLSAFQENFPEVQTINFLDEGLLIEANKQGQLTAELVDRFADLIQKAILTGVDGILLSCSTFSPTVSEMRRKFPEIPIENVDDVMVQQAIQQGVKIGVVATVAAAGPTTQKSILENAKLLNKDVEVFVEVSKEAFEALSRKEYETHDALIAQKVRKLLSEQKIDVIILAQLSMARAKAELKDIAVPILTSPEISSKAIVERMAKKVSS